MNFPRITKMEFVFLLPMIDTTIISSFLRGIGGNWMRVIIFSVRSSWENEVISFFLPCKYTSEQDQRLCATLQVFDSPFTWKRYLFIYRFGFILILARSQHPPGNSRCRVPMQVCQIESRSWGYFFYYYYWFCLIMLPQGLNEDHSWIWSRSFFIQKVIFNIWRPVHTSHFCRVEFNSTN